MVDNRETTNKSLELDVSRNEAFLRALVGLVLVNDAFNRMLVKVVLVGDIFNIESVT